MTQRINTLQNPEGKAAELLGSVKQALGSTPNLFTTIATSPAALEGYLGLNSALQGGALSGKLRESVALTSAGYNGCDYCASAHTFLGNKAGLDEAELQANLRGESSDSKTQAALSFTTKVIESRGHPSEADVNAVRDAGYSNEEIIEIVAHVALNTLTNYFNESFGVEVDFPKVSAKPTQAAA